MLNKEITGHVGKRGTIVLPAATRRRYGLEDGALFISEETINGILIRPAQAVPKNLAKLRAMIKQGFDEVDRGEGLDGEKVFAELRQKNDEMRKSKLKRK